MKTVRDACQLQRARNVVEDQPAAQHGEPNLRVQVGCERGSWRTREREDQQKVAHRAHEADQAEQGEAGCVGHGLPHQR